MRLNSIKKLQSNPFLYYTLPLIICVITMITLSSIPGDTIPKIKIIQWDKIAHFSEFVGFVILLSRYFFFVKMLPYKKVFIFSSLVGILYPIIDELHQLFIPFRDCSLADLSADLFGVIIGSYLFWRIFIYKPITTPLKTEK